MNLKPARRPVAWLATMSRNRSSAAPAGHHSGAPASRAGTPTVSPLAAYSLPPGSAFSRTAAQGTKPDVARHCAEGEDHERPQERGCYRDGAVDQGCANTADAEYRGAGPNARSVSLGVIGPVLAVAKYSDILLGLPSTS
ncbi:hypothetical protein ABZ446_46095 [Streptomyces sp. NPDC005813]|uniref:hypothetical protein n=1 Tax=Streptomyces sp. NPDC005813 TaxID=3155592 RepID=UPI0033F70ACD